MNKYLIIVIIIIIIFLLYNCYFSFSENFADSEQSIGGVDDNNAINTLAQLARKLMDGGAKVPGNLTTDKLSLGAKFQLSGIGDGMGNDDWLRLVNPADPAKYNGGFATQKLWTQNIALNGDLNADGNAVVKGNLTTNGFINSGVDKWNISNDGINRTYYGNKANSYYGSANGVHNFRTGANGNGPDGMVLDQNSTLNLNGALNLQGGVMNTYKGRWWKLINRIDMPGGDITDFGCGSLNEGIASCVDRFPHTMSVGFNGNHCWCKNHHANAQPRDNWQIALII